MTNNEVLGNSNLVHNAPSPGQLNNKHANFGIIAKQKRRTQKCIVEDCKFVCRDGNYKRHFQRCHRWINASDIPTVQELNVSCDALKLKNEIKMVEGLEATNAKVLCKGKPGPAGNRPNVVSRVPRNMIRMTS